MQRSLINDILNQGTAGQTVQIGGWLRTRRDSRGGFSFLEISDGSCIHTLQVVVDASLENYENEILKLKTGAALIVEGTLKNSEGKGQRLEMQAGSVMQTGVSSDEFPIQKKRHSFEHLRTMQHLRPRTNTIAAVLRVRSKLSHAIHSFFQQRSFHYIQTPIITASDCEGAGHLFQVTTLPPGSQRQPDADFFGLPTYLTVSGQLEGEACALALGQIYTFGPTFRAENSNTSRHLAEFWMVEPEVAFARLDQNAALAEDFLKAVTSSLLASCADDLAFFNQRIDSGVLERLHNLVEQPFERITYSEAVQILELADIRFEFPVKWGSDLQSEHERYLCETHFGGPVIVTDYPKEIKSFYMRLNDDDKTVAAMDVLAPGIGEIIGGSEREERLDVLSSRMQASGLDPEEYSWYLDLRRYGSAPHSGFGLGLDRFVQYITGMENIRDVSAFPRTPRHARVHSAVPGDQLRS
ncbi:MAG: asparagine--tRNA ligase [Leptospiraceae bacterium]|nr:asparagine--tRNA ligase [Leptospiraceae bacterium]